MVFGEDKTKYIGKDQYFMSKKLFALLSTLDGDTELLVL